MKVYTAARYSMKDEVAEYANELRAAGIGVTSRWLEEPHSPQATMGEVDVNLLRSYARQDVEDIKAADILVFFSVSDTTPMVRGGRHVEFGIAMALGLHIVVIGPKENIFHLLPEVIHFETKEQAKNYLLGVNA